MESSYLAFFLPRHSDKANVSLSGKKGLIVVKQKELVNCQTEGVGTCQGKTRLVVVRAKGAGSCQAKGLVVVRAKWAGNCQAKGAGKLLG